MAERRGYQPSPEEMQKAESMMTPEQKKMSALRERKLEELKAGEAAIKTEGGKKELTVEQKREHWIRKLQKHIELAKVRLRLYEKDAMIPEKPGRPPNLLNSPEHVYDKTRRQLEQVISERRKRGLPELLFNDLSYSNISIARERRAFATHAKSFGNEPGYSRSFMDLARSPMWIVSTDRSPRDESNNAAYKSDGVVIVFTHPREAIREMTRYIDDLKSGRVDGFPAGAITFAEDFAEGVEKHGMPE